MINRLMKFGILLLIGFMATTQVVAGDEIEEKRVKVALRKIGHETLLSLGDSVSHVLPITNEGNEFVIGFESTFSFDPFYVAGIVDSILDVAAIEGPYIVEFKRCSDSSVVHSYEMLETSVLDEMACGGRIIPDSCYTIHITLLNFGANSDEDVFLQSASPSQSSNGAAPEEKTWTKFITTQLLPVLFFIGLMIYVRKKRKPEALDPDVVQIGLYKFNTRNMVLIYEDEETDLTSKEADLLALLHGASNSVLKREEILNAVWGDEGDYVGRTLDVFISKLRKKLAADESLKIVNIHGVGYKFVTG